MDTPYADSSSNQVHDDAAAFVRLLVEHGACAEADTESILRPGQQPWRHLGRVLIARGVLTFTDVSYILEAQDREPESRFGDLAVELGFCTRREVEEAVEHQNTSGGHFLDSIASHPAVDRARLIDALVAWSKRLGSALERELREKRPA